jgi:general secretion pathway protein N
MAAMRVRRPCEIALLICLILVARAAAATIETRTGFTPRVEAGSAPAETHGLAEAGNASRGPSTSDAGAKSRVSNPLWSAPLEALSATRDRPLFSPSRRSPSVAPSDPLPQKQEALAPLAPERPALKLVGTIVSSDKSVAILQGSSPESMLRLRVGQNSDGWLVQKIGLRSIVVEKGSQSVQLELPKVNEGQR